MKTFKTFLMAATALSISAGAALADDNKAFTTQTGNDNSIMIDQAGGDKNLAGRSLKYVTQNGDDNTLTILQIGDENKFGATSNINSGEVTQTGSRNVLDAEQNGLKNQTANVLQTAPGGLIGPSNIATIKQLRNYGGIGTVTQTSAVSSASVMNTATLIQMGGNSNKVSTVYQEFTGAGGSNELSIVQNGPTNSVGSAKQIGHENMIDISQTGRSNKVLLADQNGANNSMSLTFNGDFNGNGFFSGNASSIGLAEATANQLGDNNVLAYDVIGSHNLFAFNQVGDTNMIEGTVDGNYNQVAIAQLGNSNTANFTQIGNNNNLGVSQ